MNSRLVVVGGGPATGKTTLAVALGTALGLPVITKDDIKESLAEPFATGDREWSRQLGRSTYAVLWTVTRKILSGGGGLVLESNFTRTWSETRLRELSSLAPTCMIICRVPDALRRQRYAARAARGERHRVHVDAAVLEEWDADDSDFLVDIGTPSLVVDTTDGYAPDIDRIVAFARAPAGFRP
jgi:predicted kinase